MLIKKTVISSVILHRGRIGSQLKVDMTGDKIARIAADIRMLSLVMGVYLIAFGGLLLLVGTLSGPSILAGGILHISIGVLCLHHSQGLVNGIRNSGRCLLTLAILITIASTVAIGDVLVTNENIAAGVYSGILLIYNSVILYKTKVWLKLT